MNDIPHPSDTDSTPLEALTIAHLQLQEQQVELESANEQLQEQQAELEDANQQLRERGLELQQQRVEMEAQNAELLATTESLRERTLDAEAGERRARFLGDIAGVIISMGDLPDLMQRCCQAAVDRLDAAFCRVWVLDSEGKVLVLTASAGMYTHLNGGHARVPVGQFKIGLIAEEAKPHVTNSVIGDPRVSEQEWARREGMVAFAGFPLIVGGALVGVMAMFARQLLSDLDVTAFSAGARAVSVAVHNAGLFRAEREARELAEHANRSKSAFLATMSHELRTPLNAIRGYADLMDMGLRGAVTVEQQLDLERIRRAQQHLLGLINGVLDYAKIGAGAVRYDLETLSLHDVLATTEALVVPQAREKEIALFLPDVDEGLSAHADRSKLEQILLNLLSNAVKFTPTGGEVRVSCERSGDGWVLVHVSDTGPGIAPDQIEAVFQPFVQLDAKLTRGSEGTGLGLAISRDLASGMGGDLTVKSEVGAGSQFTVRLPAA